MRTYTINNGEAYSDHVIYGTVTVDDNISPAVLYAAARDAITNHKNDHWKYDSFKYFLEALTARGVEYTAVDFAETGYISLT